MTTMPGSVRRDDALVAVDLEGPVCRRVGERAGYSSASP